MKTLARAEKMISDLLRCRRRAVAYLQVNGDHNRALTVADEMHDINRRWLNTPYMQKKWSKAKVKP